MSTADSTTVQLFDDLVATIASEQRADFRAHYKAITRLAKSKLTLQEFLDAFLHHVTHLYAANAAAIWFRAPDAPHLAAKASLGIDRIGLAGEFVAPHERLLQFALEKRKSFLVKPFSVPESVAGRRKVAQTSSDASASFKSANGKGDSSSSLSVSNPTDSFLLLGPVDHFGERIAVVELFLGPNPMRGRTAAERNRYVLWLDHLLGYLCRGVELRLLRKSAPLAPALAQLASAESSVNELQAAIGARLEQQLAMFVGWSFGTLEDNQAFATRVHELLDQFGLRAICPQCGAPAIVRCQNAGNSKTGVFLFDHTLETGRTFHGGPTTFPRLSLVSRPVRRKSRG